MPISKQYILEEIKRTAEVNNNRPLGRERFAQETGIKLSDWYGIYWTRWSDAICEAGFQPNQMQHSYDERFLFEKLVELIRELGRIPTYGEIRLKARNDPQFPSHNTFTRFGTKHDLILKLTEHCCARHGYEDVVQLCKPVIQSGEKIIPENRVRPDDDKFGFVYLLKSGRFYKIGKSNAVGRREREIAVQLPEKARTIHVIRTDDPAGIERYWHKRFDDKRKNGEWFELSATDVKAFKRRKFM